MNLGLESEKIEFKKSTSELVEGVISISAMLNKHGEATVYILLGKKYMKYMMK